ncbi:MAG: gliding motility protein GldL [Chitinophagales bacterium]|nr:gliding motility protein GldL [Chitinophagales bacterium]MCZ2392683.1 gliding motility protein GldL [Chitinophagales bacterium]
MASVFHSKGFKYAKNLLFGVGASVVIIGAWGKLTHLPWANVALTVGLMTEAIIFAISGIIPPEPDYYWSKLFPGLEDPESTMQGIQGLSAPKAAGSGSTASLDKMLDEAKIDQSTINRLGDNLKKLSENVNSISGVLNAHAATENFVTQTKQAADSMTSLSKNIEAQTKQANDAMGALSSSLDNLTKVYGNMLSAMKS